MKKQQISNKAEFLANLLESTESVDIFRESSFDLREWQDQVKSNKSKADVRINLPMSAVVIKGPPRWSSEPLRITDVFGFLNTEYREIAAIGTSAELSYHPIQGRYSLLVVKKLLQKRHLDNGSIRNEYPINPVELTDRYFDFEVSDGETKLVFKNGQLVD